MAGRRRWVYLWFIDWPGADFCGQVVVYALYQCGPDGGVGCLSQIFALSRFLLLESRTAQCLQNECPGNGLLRKSDFLGRNGNDCTNLCQLCFCRNIRIYSHLFCRSDSMGFSNIIYYAGVPDVSEAGNKRA